MRYPRQSKKYGKRLIRHILPYLVLASLSFSTRVRRDGRSRSVKWLVFAGVACRGAAGWRNSRIDLRHARENLPSFLSDPRLVNNDQGCNDRVLSSRLRVDTANSTQYRYSWACEVLWYAFH
jgi:hypothetical protein